MRQIYFITLVILDSGFSVYWLALQSLHLSVTYRNWVYLECGCWQIQHHVCPHTSTHPPNCDIEPVGRSPENHSQARSFQADRCWDDGGLFVQVDGEDKFLYCDKRMHWTVQLHNENHAHLQCMVDPPSRSIDTILSDSPHCFGHCRICRWKVWCTSRSVGESSNKRRTNLQWKSVTMSFYFACVVNPHLIVFQVVQLL